MQNCLSEAETTTKFL